jgi:hypothetical protein
MSFFQLENYGLHLQFVHFELQLLASNFIDAQIKLAMFSFITTMTYVAYFRPSRVFSNESLLSITV